jgi:ribonuclease Z
MENFDIHILGCGSALPTSRHALSSQVINFRGKLFMIDCGEGSQLQFRAMHLNFSHLNHIFISHLHGDHCLGLPGLISTLGMLDRAAPLHIYAQPEAPQIFRPILDYFCPNLPFPVEFHCFDPIQSSLIYEDRTLTVSTIPLHHRVSCAGFLFEEKPKSPHILPEMIDLYKVPLNQIQAIKNGFDFLSPFGQQIPHEQFVRPADPSRRYAYCSDTAYSEKIIPLITGVDLLYHEATYAEKDGPAPRNTSILRPNKRRLSPKKPA